ncbi:hypothetical protein ENUP19_0146G0041 [Entamoeba nuttalli]|uniref:TLDc domain-containing protein n=2 Tax=Entamoeba nuttalli TaxID=412467 RepID=K2G7L6_ENTNP|nr:hypothetical protein ENU1_166780 [Entamoeba nuttalli P19]EKE38426.1 hypothetical protein ENU1_166780 [Entamoeba nuttalli P19]|eukprot:XP_008859242.1 hypothetical protein ENU1_166780 [Entamoeba nuttalli P19]
MQQLEQLEKQLELFGQKVNEMGESLKSLSMVQNGTEELIKKTRALRETSQKHHQELLEALNSHQQTIERQISEIRIAMGCSIAGERRNPLSDEDIQRIEILTGKTAGEVIYQASVDGFSNNHFNENVGGKESIVLVIFDSEGNVFGSYNSKQIPEIKKEEIETIPAKGLYNDSDHFLFVLRKKGVSDVRKFTRKADGYSLWVFGSIDNLLSVNGAFVLVNECNRSFDSSISGNFRREYDEDMFIDKKKFMVRDIVAISFN